jgi:integrase
VGRVFQRKGNWWIDFNDARGIRHRRKVGPSKRVAKEILDGVLGNVARRQHLGVIEDSAISVSDFALVWWNRIAHTLKPRTRERWLGIVEKHLKPAFSGALRSLTPADAEGYVARRIQQGAKPSTVNREMTVLKHMLRRAVGWEYLSRNPFLDAQGEPLQGLKPLREPPGRVRFLSHEEIDRLLAACEFEDARSELARGYLRAFILVALNTGMRRNEILALSRRQLDWQNRVATLTETKNGEQRYVHLNDLALAALRSLPSRLEDQHFFPFRPYQVSMAVRRAVRRAGLDDFRLHDCRHTFASYQAMAGIQPRGLQALLGHKDNRMTMRYAHLSDTYLRAAVNAVNLGSSDEKSGTHLAPAIGSRNE